MSDVFRTVYRDLTEQEKKAVEAIKAKAHELYELIEAVGPIDEAEPTRYTSLSKNALEESVMWACKQLTHQFPTKR